MFRKYAHELPITRSHGDPGPQPAIGFSVSAYHNNHIVSALAARKQSRPIKIGLDAPGLGWPRLGVAALARRSALRFVDMRTKGEPASEAGSP
jgi:hypothetical protein